MTQAHAVRGQKGQAGQVMVSRGVEGMAAPKVLKQVPPGTQVVLG